MVSYVTVGTTLMLPHAVYLLNRSYCFTVEPGTECNARITYLTTKCQLLEPHEHYVTMLLDERVEQLKALLQIVA